MNDWHCPHCGKPMDVKHHIDNATGRSGYTIGCTDPSHFQSPQRDTPEQAERALKRMLEP